MRPEEGTPQRHLYRVSCEWEGDVHEHGAAYPVFGADYKTHGVIGLTLGEELVWYPEAPSYVQRRHLRFKTTGAEERPLDLPDWPAGLLEERYLCDPWGVLVPLLEGRGLAERVGRPTDLFGRRLMGGQFEPRGTTGRCIDVVFEKPLHRVRGVTVRRGTFRTRTLSVLEMPALSEALLPDVRAAAGGEEPGGIPDLRQPGRWWSWLR